jgi:LytS/YehU family sensor histidine kinase
MCLFLKDKRNIVYAFLFYLIIFFYPDFKHLFDPIFSVWLKDTKFMDEPHTIALNFYCVTSAISSSFYGALFYLGIDWYRKKEQKKELEKKNLQSELAMLKNQINPHFLFNTLNNIDSMIKKNPDCASETIVSLSDMMRYMIYETNVEKVPLRKELDYIDNYLNLQKLQYGNPELVANTVSGEENQAEIAPMLFIPFIENAFKHCTNKETKHAIRLSFLFDAQKICFEATNISDKTQTISKDQTSGIGLDTVKRRLEILYPQRYELRIEEKNDLFCVSLMIKIND